MTLKMGTVRCLEAVHMFTLFLPYGGAAGHRHQRGLVGVLARINAARSAKQTDPDTLIHIPPWPSPITAP